MGVPDYVGNLPCEQEPGECGCNCVEIESDVETAEEIMPSVAGESCPCNSK